MKKVKDERTLLMRKIDEDFDVAGYKYRLQLLREIVSGENQVQFAKRLGVPFKRWSNYERGYPVPRETAWLICQTFPGISAEWLWWGWQGNLKQPYKKRIEAAQKFEKERLAAERAAEEAQARLKAVSAKRKKAVQPTSEAER